MHTSTTLQAVSGSSSGSVRIGFNHGYAFNGDSVQLDAELLVNDPQAAAGQEWALQLWACGSPFDGQPIPAFKLAELPIGSLDAGARAWVSAPTAACPPAGQGAYRMVLVLASGRDGRFDQVQDYANYARAEAFAQPYLVGSTGYRFGEGSVALHAEGVDNPRTVDNLSGTLSLELWALAAPYTGGAPDGVQLAATSLGSLAGQSGWQGLDFDLPQAARPAGTWHIALLLREWTAGGYVTRDFSNFGLPVQWHAEAEAEAPVAEASPAPASSPAKPAARAAKDEIAAPATVSVNTASEAELAAVKGLPKAVAAAIAAARPFKTLDELVKVKGMGVKLLDKLKARLKL